MNEKVLFFFSALFQFFQNFGQKKTDLKISSIAVVKLDEIGDFVYSLHVIEKLKKEYANASITLLIKPFNKIFVQRENIKIVHKLEDLPEKVDLFIDLRGNLNSLFCAIDCNPFLYFGRGMVRMKNKIKGGQKHEIITNWEIVQDLFKGDEMLYPKISINQSNHKKASEFLLTNKLEGKQFVVFHPGAREKARRWSAQNFADLAKYLFTKYRLPCVFVGAPEENNLILEIQSNIQTPSFSFADASHNLLDFAALVCQSALFVGNESGPLHIASLTGTKNLGLFGPGVVGVFYPMGQHSKVIHPFFKDKNKRNESMKKISLDEVCHEAEKLLKNDL